MFSSTLTTSTTEEKVVLFLLGLLSGYLLKLKVHTYLESLLASPKHPNSPSVSDHLSSSSSDDDDDDEDEDEVPMKMVLVVRTDLKMGKGKIAAQCCHACLGCYRRVDSKALKKWFRIGQTKVVLKVASKEALHKVRDDASKLNIPFYIVADAGRTQIEPGSETVIAIGPVEEDKMDMVCGQLKLM